ncbi:MAG: tetratricopeptide repeat protein [Planctomycetota bacterium]|jgi:tetratricopeptide (TPR) repeat protein
MSETKAAPAPAPSPWILGRWADLALFIATPALIIPLFFTAKSAMPIQDLALFILAFGALGHHLPGMMRAYGDTALFREFRVRFIVAPILLAVGCVFIFMNNMRIAILAIYLWGIWHGLMQTYGFVRIYDAKAGSVAPVTQRLDLMMCISWFITGVLVSPARFYQLLEYWHVNVGGPIPAQVVLEGVRLLAVVATAAITVAFLVNHVRQVRAGRPPSRLKLLLMATSFGFWWWANLAFVNMLVGVILFEVFHDVQYLAIVWVFNHGRAKKDAEAGSFTRFLFHRGGMLAGLYVGLVFAYGSLRFVERSIDEQALKAGLAGLLAASTLLHFYYDGFIWKFRKQKNTDALEIARAEDQSRRWLVPGGPAAHAGKWALFVLPVAILGWNEWRSFEGDTGRRAEGAFARLENLVEVLPENPYVHHEYGEALHQRLQHSAALASFERAMELGIETSSTGYFVGALTLDEADRTSDREARMDGYRRAAAAFERSLELNPHSASTHARLGDAYRRLERTEDARAMYDASLAMDEGQWRAHFGLAELAAAAGDLPQALVHVRAGVGGQADSDLTEGGAVGMLAYDAGGGLHYERMRKVKDEREQPEVVAHRVADVAVLVAETDPEEAISLLDFALDLNPDATRILIQRGLVLGPRLERWDAALSDFIRSHELQPEPQVLMLVAGCEEKLGRPDRALAFYRRSLQRDPSLEVARRNVQRLERELGLGPPGDAEAGDAGPAGPAD